ncbi:PREDICTED: actin-binding protein anillin-like [Rhagoletis zephyria]|uniref:actin-binding protein anillin-like n=1 Tax=Rhagoletis zephyria TaxID=28612 RepID=UPI0008119E9C|nr:PREDICTED: actin-binding protein anillin-like [Rhagoletis zephyria]
MDETNTELDSFTAAMLARVRARKEQLDRLENDEDTEALGENENNKSSSEGSLSDDDDSLLLSNMPNDDKDRHVRKSISMLLNVREPVLPVQDEPDVHESPAKFATTTRLNKRLCRLTELYHDETEGTKVLTQNKVNIAPATEEVEKPKVGLKDRLNNLTRFYYPIHEDDDVSKPSTPSKQPSSQCPTINTPILVNKTKIVKFIEQFDTPNKPQSPEKVVKKIQPPTPAVVSKPANPAPMKKTSVADLKKLFENKAEEEQSKPKEVAPEMLSLREKRRLFEKAIREESEASKNVYRGGQRRVMELSPTRSDEGDAKRLKSVIEQHDEDVATLKSSPTNVVVEDQHQNDTDYMSICTDSSTASKKEEDEPLAEEEESSDVLKVSTVSVTDSLDKALESIDNYSISQSAVSSEFNDETVGDITFSALETDQALQRSSTRVDLKSDSQSSVEAFQQPKNPPQPNAEPANTDEAPQLRTISFYRREKKAKELAEIGNAYSPAPTDDRLKHQQAEEEQRNAREEFLRGVHNRIVALKNDISEHNRIFSQASQALNLTYQATNTDSELMEGRVEAERLLLIAEEKRKACKGEIERLKRLQVNPDRYISQSIPSRGLLKISNLSVPLRKEFVELRAKGKASTYFFICLVINGPQVYVSELLDTSKSADKDSLEFKFKAYCKDLKDDFEVGIHLYAMELQTHNAPKKEAGFRSFRIKFGTSSLKKAEKAALATNSPLPSKLTAGGSSSSFNLVGVVKLTLPLLRQKPLLYRFEYPAVGPKLHIPIDNYLSIQEQTLSVQHRLTVEGCFDIQDPKTSFWNLRRVVISGNQLKYWRFPETSTESDSPPLGVINLKHCINPTVSILKGEDREICMRVNTIALVTLKPPPVSNAQKLVQGGKISKSVPERLFISSSSKSSILQLCEQINKVLGGIRAWENDAVRPYSVDEFKRLLLKN